MFWAFMEESKAQMLHQKDHHRFMLIAVLFKYFEWLRVVQSLLRAMVQTKMVSKFKLDHFVHVKKNYPEIFLGPPGGPSKFISHKMRYSLKSKFYFVSFLAILVG